MYESSHENAPVKVEEVNSSTQTQHVPLVNKSFVNRRAASKSEASQKSFINESERVKQFKSGQQILLKPQIVSDKQNGDRPIQRVINITELPKSPIPPTGKDANRIWDEIRLLLLNRNINPYGLKTNYYLPMLKSLSDVHDYDTEEEFKTAFVEEIVNRFRDESAVAEDEESRGVSRKDRTKRTVRVFAMARPGWPEHYRESLGALPGDDIRHVVRNATLKRAIEYEESDLRRQGWDEDRLSLYFQNMAHQLGAPIKEHSREEVKAIYHKVYLHMGNLFAGPGAVNQAIGFSADPITNYGKHLQSQGDQLVQERAVTTTIWKEINSRVAAQKTKAAKMDSITSRRFLEGLNGYESHLRDYLQAQSQVWISSYSMVRDGEYWVRADEIAQDVIDIGDNFGFDLILASHDDPKVRRRHAELVSVEKALQKREFTPGKGGLTVILSKFLNVPASLAKGDSMSKRAGLVFPVGRVSRYMKNHIKRRNRAGKAGPRRGRIGASAPIYLAAVLEYLTAELLELSGNKAAERGRKRILPTDIIMAVKEDSELNALLHISVEKTEEEKQ